MNSRWWEVRVSGAVAQEEVISWRLQDFGCQGTASQVQGELCQVWGYLPQQQFQHLDLAALSLWLREDTLIFAHATEPPLALPELKVDWQLINEEDWATTWQQHWHPQEVGDRLLINPAWLPISNPTERLVLQLNPGVAFGTGTHATTQLCLEALEMQLDPSFDLPAQITIADIGCGTGILAIAAILLGAHRVYAVDTDPLAVEAAGHSRELNQISPEQLMIQEGSVDQIPGPVNGIVCNILAEIIINLTPQMTSLSQPGTWGIFSGVLINQSQSVVDALEQHGWRIGSVWRREDWCCINAQRSSRH